MDLQKKVIIITGASEGIGKALAKKLAPNNYLILVGRNYEKLNYQLIDLNGREIINSLLTPNQNLLDLQGLNSGIYTLKIYNQENLLKKSKIIKR